MKKILIVCLCFFSVPTFAQQFNDLTRDDVKDVSREFGANFAHTGVSAPETDGVWGVEVGLVAGSTSSSNLEDVVDRSGGDGEDFQTIYHAGLMVRGHFPYDLFAEISVLPNREISDVEVESKSFEVGWNAGAFFNLPVDLAVAVNRSNAEISFDQTQPVASTISLETTTDIIWVGVSKSFWFFTPYFKVGHASIEADLRATANIFAFTTEQSESSSESGTYAALGANFQFWFLKLGVEGSQIIGERRASAKLSIDF